MERLGPHSQAESFDFRFWQRQGINAKWLALWSMVSDYYNIKGRHGNKLRLQRTVQSIKQI